jgi:hypothetical protein
MQEAYLKGYWGELSDFIRGLFNNTFKANQYLERAILTGVTRVSKESIFSDLNNLEVVSVTSPKYANVFGFTEDEVFQALDEFGFNNKSEVKRWYDGFAYGGISGIYNPWSILKYLDSGVLDTYWVNTSSNALISKSIQSSSPTVKDLLQTLLDGDSIDVAFDEQFVYGSLDTNESAIWGLLVSSGYLKIVEYTCDYTDYGVSKRYKLKITNYEVRTMFSLMIRDWFSSSDTSYPYQSFLKALISDNVDAMNLYMGIVIENTFSYFDVSGKQSERFYHGFVLGLITEFSSRYIVKSNRESGLGRYDVMLEPKLKSDNAIIIEFKVCYGNGNMRDILEDALHQIEVNQYDADLLEHGFGKSQIKKYGFVFRGKECLIGKID